MTCAFSRIIAALFPTLGFNPLETSAESKLKALKHWALQTVNLKLQSPNFFTVAIKWCKIAKGITSSHLCTALPRVEIHNVTTTKLHPYAIRRKLVDNDMR